MKRKYIKWGLVVIWAALIFIFSSQTGEVSGQNNRFIMNILSRIGIDLDAITGGIGNLIIRKAAHFTEFMVLYILLYNALNDDFYKRPSLIIALALTVIYAISDEIHQSFVDGRGPAVLDVLIDTAGGLFGAAVINISEFIAEKRRRIPPYYRSEE